MYEFLVAVSKFYVGSGDGEKPEGLLSMSRIHILRMPLRFIAPAFLAIISL